jgi:hypothetical protein
MCANYLVLEVVYLSLPSLKSELVKLALLLNLEVETSDTVPILKSKIQPSVALLKGYKSKAPEPSTPQAKPKPKAAASSPESMSSSWSTVTHQGMQELSDMLEAKVQQAIGCQDQKVEAMMSQVMHYIENRFSQMPLTAGAGGILDGLPQPMDP